jgi:hypothetical protein
MATACAVVSIVTISPNLRAQRHGRPDSAQLYAKGVPEATLTLMLDGDRHIVQRKDFASLPRTSRGSPGGNAGSGRTFTGVLLADLVTTHPAVRQYDIHYGFFHTRHLDDSLVRSPADILVADHVDGRAIDRASLFDVIATTRDGNTIVIRKVSGIVLR